MIIFIDMDGVVSDFDEHILKIYNKSMLDMETHEKRQFWNVGCVKHKFFAKSPIIPNGIQLVQNLKKLKINLCFLTSTGGGLQHTEIAKQKLTFLHENNLQYIPVTFARGTKSKASFAHPNAILIDDREKVTKAFENAGGTSFLFKKDNADEIFNSIKQLVEEKPDE